MENNLEFEVKDLIDDPDMQSAELDEITLSRKQTTKGLILFLVCSIIGIVVFFGSVTKADGSSETVFSFLYNSFLNIFGQGVYWILVVLIGLVIIFKSQLTSLVQTIFEKITSESSGI